MRLNPAAFNAWLDNIGQQFKWRKAFKCPCVNQFSGAATPGCPACGGKGVLWDPAADAKAGMAGQKVQQRWQQMGQWEDGDAVVTIPENSAMYEMGKYDRVVMLNSTDYFSLALTRGDAQERIHEPVEKVTRVFWLDAQKAIVNGAIPAVNADGTLVWPGSGAPPLGTQYSITGTRFSEYFCWGNFPSDRNEHSGARLPKRVVLRRFDLFGRDLA